MVSTWDDVATESLDWAEHLGLDDISMELETGRRIRFRSKSRGHRCGIVIGDDEERLDRSHVERVGNAIYGALDALQDMQVEASTLPWPEIDGSSSHSMPHVLCEGDPVVGGYAIGEMWVDSVPRLVIEVDS